MRGDFGTLSHIPLTQIDRDPDQPRKTFNEETIAELANSIREGGLVEPLVVKNSPHRGRFILVAGERRFRAVRLLRWQAVPCIVKPGEQDTYILSVIENLNREDLNPIDEALVYRKMRNERRMSWQAIHDVTRRSLPTIMAKVKLLELPEEIQAMVRTGTLPQVSALGLAQYSGPKGEMIKLAYDLIAGREAEIPDVGTTKIGDAVMKAKIPKEPQKILRRIRSGLWGTRSMHLLVQAMEEQPEPVRRNLLSKLNSAMRKNLLDNLETLSQTCSRFHASVEATFRAIDEEAKQKVAEPEPPVRVTIGNKQPDYLKNRHQTVQDPSVEALMRIERAQQSAAPAPRFVTPLDRQQPASPIKPTKPGEGWKSARGGRKRPPREPRPVFSTLPSLRFVEPLLQPRPKVVAEKVDLSALSAEQLDQAAELLYRVFKFQHSRTPQVEREKRFLSRVTGIPEDQVEARVQESLRIVRQIWSDGNGLAHEPMLRRIATLKESSGAQTFEEFYTVVPTDIKDDSFISFQPLL